MTPDDVIDRAFQPQFKADSGMATYKSGCAVNAVCGDTCVLFVKLKDNTVEDARHSSDGCTICCASADLLCEKMIGKPVDFKINLFAELGIPIGINRRQCVVTPQKALVEALK